VSCILYMYFVGLYWNRKGRELFQETREIEEVRVPGARKHQDKLTVFPSGTRAQKQRVQIMVVVR
jgi:hypothetical protein